MSACIVSYDLVKAKDYKALIDQLTALGAVKAQLSCWFVKSAAGAAPLFDRLLPFVDNDDRLMVIGLVPGDWKVRNNLLPGALEWLKANV